MWYAIILLIGVSLFILAIAVLSPDDAERNILCKCVGPGTYRVHGASGVDEVIKEVLECCTMQQCKPSLRLVRGFAPELDPRVNKAILAYCMKDAKLWNHKTKLVHKHVEYWRNHPTIRIAQTPESVATALSIPVEDVRTAFETIGYNPAGAESSRILATGEDVSGYSDEGIAEHTLQNGT